MPLEEFLSAAGFTGVDLFGQYPTFKADGGPMRYALAGGELAAGKMTLAQLWPSDRPTAWFVAVLNLSYEEPTLDYGTMPRGSAGIGEVLRRYLDLANAQLWKQPVNYIFPYHPWVRRDGERDVGVPGTMQFLTEFPFCEPVAVDGRPIEKRVAMPSRTVLPVVAERQEEKCNPFSSALRRMEL